MEKFITTKARDDKRNKIKTRNVRVCAVVFTIMLVLFIWLLLLRNNIKKLQYSIHQIKDNINSAESERNTNKNKLQQEINKLENTIEISLTMHYNYISILYLCKQDNPTYYIILYSIFI